MFERRLKILLVLLVLATLVLFGRSFTLQVVHGSDYALAERKLSVRPPELSATTRGRILDRTGRAVLAVDTACTDACVDYRAIPDQPDAKWVDQQATGRLRARYGADWRRQFPKTERDQKLADAVDGVRHDVEEMWRTLARLYRPADAAAAADAVADPVGALGEVRRSIVHEVETRRRVVWTASYRRGRERAAAGSSWSRWLGLSSAPVDPGTTDGSGAAAIGPDIDAFQIKIDDERQPHVVLHALDAEATAFLGKQLEHCPGLSLRPSTHRSYPLGDVFCHGIGRVATPTVDELRRTEGGDPRTRYELADAVGRDGVEAMCEPLLRGVRGRVDREAGSAPDDPAGVLNRQPFVPGRDATVTIDADLQRRVQQLLKHVVIRDVAAGTLVTPAEGVSMHAAAVVLDVRTNQVLALASNPTFDVNELDTRYAALAGDTLEGPLLNRAVVDAMNPGSTAKPMVGIGAITQGAIGPRDGIECTGYLILPAVPPTTTAPTTGPTTAPVAKPIRYAKAGRCWVASEYTPQQIYDHELLWPDTWPHPVASVAHHPINTPHVGKFGNPDGFLCYADAVERSCNVYFETVADRLGPGGMDRWLEAFGIGRVTGIGLRESPGLRPSQSHGRDADPRLANCYAGIGQGAVLATPLQIANEAATFARGGVWMRPRLLSDDTQAALDAAAPPSSTRPKDRDDLQLDPEGLREAKVGMVGVAAELKRQDGRPVWLTAAAKTGTAQVSPLVTTVTEADGRRVRRLLEPTVRGGPETSTPWYRSNSPADKTVTHNWVMGYAPADDPQVAFAVLIEYGGSSGGSAAGPVAGGILDACRDDGYLRDPAAATTRPATQP